MATNVVVGKKSLPVMLTPDMKETRGPEYDGTGRKAFSPDGSTWLHLAARGEKRFVVVDGNEGKEYDDISHLLMGPDGRHLAYWAQRGNAWLIVMDGVESREYAGVLRHSKLVFDGPNGFHALAYFYAEPCGKEVVRIEAQIGVE